MLPRFVFAPLPFSAFAHSDLVSTNGPDELWLVSQAGLLESFWRTVTLMRIVVGQVRLQEE